MPRLDDHALDVLFRDAYSHNGWHPDPIPDAVLREAYELARLGPTSANCCPMRVAFLRTSEAKERLRPALARANVEKTMSAPVTAIIAHDLRFDELLPRLFPHGDAKPYLAADAEMARATALMNGTLQGGYFLMACRALGLDCGPIAGFRKDAVDAAFFPDGRWASNFIINLGRGDTAKLWPRKPRPDVDEACLFL